MQTLRLVLGTAIAASIAAGSVYASTSVARESRRVAPRAIQSFPGIGSFTPASGDPRLAAVLARSGLNGSGFRFTPADGATDKKREITVAVRARSNRGAVGDRSATAAPVGMTLAPIAYNLGVSVGWKRFAVSGDLAKVDLAGLPGSQERLDLGVSYTGKRISGGVRAGASRPLAEQPRMISDLPSYSVDVGGAYRLTKNLDVTAGVRYRSDRDRLPSLRDERVDSQAVYVGTAFRF